MRAGVQLTCDGHLTRLKWHRLRRRLKDPLFSLDILQDGLQIGASMELDLRVRKDGGFVVLHDPDLRGETNGKGRICEKTRLDLSDIKFKGEHRPLIVSEDLPDVLALAHPEALLQFDMKDDFETVGKRGVDHLATHFSAMARFLIISGACERLIGALAERLPEIRRGIDPTDRLVKAFKWGGAKQVETDLLVELRGVTLPEMIYLEWRLLLKLQSQGLDLIALCHAEGRAVDAWTFTPKAISDGMTRVDQNHLMALLLMKPDQITTDEAIALEIEWHRLVGTDLNDTRPS